LAHGASVRAAVAGTDIGQLFRELRRCLSLPLPEIARRLESRIDVIQALEAGDVTRLPPWPETVRVVSAYTLLSGIDPRPVLHVIGERITAEAKTRMAPPKRAARAGAAPARRGRGSSGFLLALIPARVSTLLPLNARVPQLPRGGKLAGLAAMVVAAVALTLGLAPMRLNQASATGSPGLLAGLAHYMTGPKATRRDGLKWIEVEDPRSRRSDKLRQARH
jgi:hypothetical protein